MLISTSTPRRDGSIPEESADSLCVSRCCFDVLPLEVREEEDDERDDLEEDEEEEDEEEGGFLVPRMGEKGRGSKKNKQ
jgi:hypothetical protein